jgi:hypothetical protein
MSSQNEFFPKIGALAEQTDQIPDNVEEEERNEIAPVEEIESLCLQCGENVSNNGSRNTF